jgi:hypothetical protein
MNQQPNNSEPGKHPDTRPVEQPARPAPDQAKPIYDDLIPATRLEQLTTKHGEPFAAWEELVANDITTGTNAEKDFLFSFAGHFNTKEDYVTDLLEALGVASALDEAVGPIVRPYVIIDNDAVAEYLEEIGHASFVPASHGGWWVFLW